MRRRRSMTGDKRNEKGTSESEKAFESSKAQIYLCIFQQLERFLRLKETSGDHGQEKT